MNLIEQSAAIMRRFPLSEIYKDDGLCACAFTFSVDTNGVILDWTRDGLMQFRWYLRSLMPPRLQIQ